MAEQPNNSDTFPDYLNSPHLRFDPTAIGTNDPQTLKRFTQALTVLEAITDHFAEFGPWQAKTQRDLVDELNHHNGWADPEADDVTLTDLQALSHRRLLALEESIWQSGHDEPLIRFLNQLIVQTVVAETELMALMAVAAPNNELAYQRLLAMLPPEDLVEVDDPSYASVAMAAGCRCCANGTPCQTRTDEDVSEILAEANLPDSEKLACLQWIIGTGYSSLTHDIAEMAGAFLLADSQTPEASADIPDLAQMETKRPSERKPSPNSCCVGG